MSNKGDKGKNVIDEEVITPSKLENVLTWGDTSISYPLYDFVDVELIVYG
jgi:hypothetical protein